MIYLGCCCGSAAGLSWANPLVSDCSKVRSHQPVFPTNRCKIPKHKVSRPLQNPGGILKANAHADCVQRLLDLCRINLTCEIHHSHPVRERQFQHSEVNYYFKCGTLLTVLVPVQANEHNFKLFFIGAKIFCKFFKVQHSILVGVPSLHNLKTHTAVKIKFPGNWLIFGQGSS